MAGFAAACRCCRGSAPGAVKTSPREHGFTLVEAMVTIAIMGIVTAASGNLLLHIVKFQARTAALQLATDALDLQRVGSKASTTPPIIGEPGRGLATTPPPPMIDGCTIDVIDGVGLPAWAELSARCGTSDSAPVVRGWATWSPPAPSPPPP